MEKCQQQQDPCGKAIKWQEMKPEIWLWMCRERWSQTPTYSMTPLQQQESKQLQGCWQQQGSSISTVSRGHLSLVIPESGVCALTRYVNDSTVLWGAAPLAPIRVFQEIHYSFYVSCLNWYNNLDPKSRNSTLLFSRQGAWFLRPLYILCELS